DRAADGDAGSAARHLPDDGVALDDVVAVPRDRARLGGDAEPDEAALHALGLLLGEHIAPEERSLVELDGPAEAGLERRGRVVDVVAVQRQLRLEPQRVARAEADRQAAERLRGVEQRRPQADRVGARARELEAVLARVAGA